VIERTRAHLVIGLLALAAFCGQVLLLDALQEHDALLAGLAEALRAAWGMHTAGVFTRACPFVAAAFVVIGVAIALARGSRVREIAPTLALLVVGLLLAGGCKLLFARVRPDETSWLPVRDSFPSGHVTNAVLCVGTALQLVPRGAAGRGGRGVWVVMATAGLLFVPAVAFARVLLGRHWLTDVTGGTSFAIAFLALSAAAREQAALRVPLVLAVVAVPVLYLLMADGPLALPAPWSRAGEGSRRTGPRAHRPDNGGRVAEPATMPEGRKPADEPR
jgi:membrane-associated phospholipid phosphatase